MFSIRTAALSILAAGFLLLLWTVAQPELAQVRSPAKLPLQSNDDTLLEIGKPTHLKSPVRNARNVRIISYNIRWRGGDDLRQLIKLFRDDAKIGGAAILGLQEVDRKKKRTQNTNNAKLMADELGMNYAWTAPPPPDKDDEEETGVAILSSYSLTDVQRIVLPHEGPGHRRRVALGATITIDNTPIRFYSVHSETRIGVDRKMEQLAAVLQDLERFPKDMRAIVLGDFNTWEGSAVKKTHKLYEGRNFRTPFDDKPTFLRKIVFVPIEFKLDWIWLRGLDVVEFGVERKISLSDHFPLWAVVKLGESDEKN